MSFFTLLLPTFAWATYPAEVPRTGQTTSYAAGDDGDLQAGVAWPNQRFIDNNDGTVTDSLTGLEWAKDANPGGAMTWQQALDYVKTLNTGGHNDWRLPNVNELESLANLQLYNPALPSGHPFTNVKSAYWSSTSSAYYGIYYAWVVGMSDGSVEYSWNTGSFYVWPVRSGQCGSLGNSVICLPKTGQTSCYNSSGTISCSGTGQDGDIQAGVAWPSPRFADHGDGTVTDSLTGLEWTKDANPAVATKTWQQALDYVKTLNTGSHSDWRLPNERELRSLADYSKYGPALPTGHPFTNVQWTNYYWSSTSDASNAGHAWFVGMGSGCVIDKNWMNDGYCVWPVRAGQCGSCDNSATTACPATTALGADNPKLENLRDFRDSTLAQNALGRKVIQIYYNNADSINAALERSPTLRAVTRSVLEVIAPMVGKK